MSLKKYQLLLGFTFLFAIAISMVCGSIPAAVAVGNEVKEAAAPVEEPDMAIAGKKYDGNGNNLNLGLLRIGDIICVYGVKVGDGVIPGHYSHTACYIGNGKIVEAFWEGVRYSYDDIIHGASDAAIYRVSASSSQKQNAVNFMKAQLGKPYDFKWLTYIGGKEVYGSKYYCSELNWAGYKTQGIDIDRNPGWSWKYGNNVAPQEIADDGQTYLIQHAY